MTHFGALLAHHFLCLGKNIFQKGEFEGGMGADWTSQREFEGEMGAGWISNENNEFMFDVFVFFCVPIWEPEWCPKGSHWESLWAHCSCLLASVLEYLLMHRC